MRLGTVWTLRGMPMHERLNRTREYATIALAWQLPQSLVMWCAIRVGAHATTGGFGSTVVPDLPFVEAVKRWDDPRGGDRRQRKTMRGNTA